MTVERVGDLLRAAAAEERTGWSAGERRISYAEMDQRSDRIATGLLRLGVRHGDRIALNDFTTPGWPAVYFAAAKIGAVVVGLSVRSRDSEIVHILGDSGARSVFTFPSAGDIDFLGILARTRGALPQFREVVSIGTGGDRTLAELESVPPDAARLAAAGALVAPDDPVMII